MPASRAVSGWLRLSLIHGIGPRIGRQLVGASGSIAAVWGNSPADWRHIDSIGDKLIQVLKQSGPDQASHILRQCEASAITVICPDDETWPAFDAMDDAPLVMFVKGDPITLNHPKLLAVVGARKASREGRMLTRRWCRSLAGRGIGIVSGMAYGVDAAAHGGTLEGNNAPTIAVLGCGLAASFNPEQQRQVAAVANHGCVISEFLPEMEARPEHFPRRNRIIAGLATATLVMEADIRSGSLITARQATSYGREVMAVPGSVLSGYHAGCHQLIRDGAALVESPEDILRTLRWHADPTHSKVSHYKPANIPEAEILKTLRGEIMHIDALSRYCGLTVPELSPILLALELLGVVESLPGSRYAMGGG